MSFDLYGNQSRLRDLVCFLVAKGSFVPTTKTEDRNGIAVVREESFIHEHLGVEYYCRSRYLPTCYQMVIGARDWHVDVQLAKQEMRIIQNYRGDCFEEVFHACHWPGMEGVETFLNEKHGETKHRVILWFALYANIKSIVYGGDANKLARDLMMREMSDEYRHGVDAVLIDVKC